MTTGADLLAAELKARGVPFIALLCGNGLDPLLAAAQRAGIPLVDTRNEQTASYVADAYARLTGRVGVCAASSGIAHVNALAGVMNAWYDGAPMLLISGASPSSTLGRGGFQDVDQVALARPICKRVELVTQPERIPLAVHEAFAAAASGRPGPVHLTVPMDILNAQVAAPAGPPLSAPRSTVAHNAPADDAAIRRAAELLARAQRPLIVAGSGLFYARAGEALARFVAAERIPVVTPIWDRGVVDRPSDTFLGVVGAATGEPRLLPDADVVLLAGVHVNYRVRYLSSPPLAQDARIIRLDPDAAELHQGRAADVALQADGRRGLEQLADAWHSGGYAAHSGWLAEAQRRHRDFYGRWAGLAARDGVGITGAHLVEALRTVITDETLFLVDGGNIGQWAHMLLCCDRYPGHWLTCGVSGVVGWGMGGAMAARLAFPDRPVILLTGDGALGYGLPEFESAARQRLPFVVVVADDEAWGIVLSEQQTAWGRGITSELAKVDYVQVAEALGGQGYRVRTAADIAPAVRAALQADRPTLVHVPTAKGGPRES